MESAFGSIDGEALTFMTAPIPTNPTLALRAGGKKVWGTFPFHEAAYLGGPVFAGSGISDGNLRGYQKNRFGGDSSLYGNAELRLVLARIKLLVPGEFGLFGAADTGRVFFANDPENAAKWHTRTGGGIWLFRYCSSSSTMSSGLGMPLVEAMALSNCSSSFFT